MKQQKGMSYLGYLAILSAAIFIGLFAFKTGPNFFENWTVNKVVEDLSARPEVLKQSRSKVYQTINQAYRQNNLWDLKAEDTVLLQRDAKKGYAITVKYEKRTNLFSNIDLVMSFDSSSEEEAAEPGT